MDFTCGCSITQTSNSSIKLKICALHKSFGTAQIENAPTGYIQTRWAVASDENDLGKINIGVALALAEFPLVADYPGDDFYAYIWVENGEYIGEVWNQKEKIGLDREKMLSELVQVIRQKYGRQ